MVTSEYLNPKAAGERDKLLSLWSKDSRANRSGNTKPGELIILLFGERII